MRHDYMLKTKDRRIMILKLHQSFEGNRLIYRISTDYVELKFQNNLSIEKSINQLHVCLHTTNQYSTK